MLKRSLIVAAMIALGGPAALAADGATDAAETVIVIKDHHFQPDEIKVSVGQPLKLVIDNQDATPEEFESHDLRIEKIVPGNSKAIIRVEPLEAGEYRFVGEFNEDTAKGKLVAE